MYIIMYTVATLVFPVHLRWCVHRNNNNNNNNNNNQNLLSRLFIASPSMEIYGENTTV